MNKYLQYILVISLFFCACDDKEIIKSNLTDDNAVTMSFYAGIESFPDSLQTRTTLDGKVSDNTRKILWLPDDNIYVTNGSTSAKFTNINEDTVNIARFEGSLSEGDNYFAAFPYSMVNGYSSSQFQITLPSVQQYVKDGIAAESFPMVAQCTDNQFNFRNVCGIFVLNLTGEDVIDSIRFSGTDAESKAIKVSGTGTIRSDYEDYPTLGMTSIAKNTVTLNCVDNKGQGVSLNKKTTTAFHIVLPIGTYSSFKLEIFSNNSSKLISKTDNPLIIRRSERTTTSKIDFAAVSHEYVDLGLSVMWASCNLGAKLPEDYGDYFAWGETSPKSSYKWTNYKYCNGTETSLTKYNSTDGIGIIDNKTILDPEDDAATVSWGGEWRMPTLEEFHELISNCSWNPHITIKMGGNYDDGYIVRSKKEGYTDKFIILPGAGRTFNGRYKDSYVCRYWTSNSTGGNGAYNFVWPEEGAGYIENRSDGLTIRPVRPSNTWIDKFSITIEQDELSMYVDGTTTINAITKDGSNVIDYFKVNWSSSNPSVVTVNEQGIVSAISIGTATITATCKGKSASCTVTVNKFEPEYVDLGLSVLWATFNLGAFFPEEYGDYFAWGETEPYYSSLSPLEWKSDKTRGYDWKSYSDNQPYGDGKNFSKYTDSYEIAIPLRPEDDAAHVNWGGDWRMPTSDEFQELIDECVWTKANLQTGVVGYFVQSKINGNSIFLPAAGLFEGKTNEYQMSTGAYWSKNYNEFSSYSNKYMPHLAYALVFDSYYPSVATTHRDYGCTVRPVTDIIVTGISIENSNIALVQGDTETIIATRTPNRAKMPITWSSSNTSIATVNQEGLVKAISIGKCTITATCGKYSDKCEVNVITPSSENHEYVDLGLSVKWATCNIGADNPNNFGDYFAWGETEPYYKTGYAQSSSPSWKTNKSTGYSWTSYKYCQGSINAMNKYCTSPSNGITDYKAALDSDDDAAHVNWGGDWRMPTYEELKELTNSDFCTCKWFAKGNVEFGGVPGYKVTSKIPKYEGNYIFLPAAGYRSGTVLYFKESNGGYWSKSLDAGGLGGSNVANGLYFGTNELGEEGYRYIGMSIRPVLP